MHAIQINHDMNASP